MNPAKCWCFTINNYNNQDVSNLDELGSSERYLIYGKEVGENGTPHLQGYVQFNKKIRFNKVKEKIGNNAHIELARGSGEDNKKYCSKEGNFKEFGEIIEKGERTDINKGIKRRLEGDTWKDIVTDIPGLAYVSNFIDKAVEEEKNRIQLDKIKTKFRKVTWKKWQQEVIDIIKNEPNERTIHWYWDSVGNVGKSFLAEYLASLGGFVTDSGKSTDISYAYNNERIVCLDLSRYTEGYIPYGLLEGFKNGRLFSGKYNSKVKRFDVPHVIVMANFKPDESRMSKDRWHIVEIKQD